jgi:hypothetical protein
MVDAFELAGSTEFEVFGLAGMTIIIRGVNKRQNDVQFRPVTWDH